MILWEGHKICKITPLIMSSSDQITNLQILQYFSVEKENKFPYFSKLCFGPIRNLFSQFWGVKKNHNKCWWKKLVKTGFVDWSDELAISLDVNE